MSNAKPGFWARYKRWFIGFFIVWVVLLAVLIFGGDGGNLPFQYQVF